MKFSVKVDNGPANKILNFDGDPDHESGSGCGLIRRALAEVCTVPVLLVPYYIVSRSWRRIAGVTWHPFHEKSGF